MLTKKICFFIFVVFMLVITNFIGVHWLFYQYIFCFSLKSDIDRLGMEYQGAIVLDDSVSEGENRYMLVKTVRGETRLIAMESSIFYPGRYRYSPGSTMIIPDERPYNCTVRTSNSIRFIRVDASDRVRVLEGMGGASYIEMIQRILPFVLLAMELLVFAFVYQIVKKKRQRLV